VPFVDATEVGLWRGRRPIRGVVRRERALQDRETKARGTSSGWWPAATYASRSAAAWKEREPSTC